MYAIGDMSSCDASVPRELRRHSKGKQAFWQQEYGHIYNELSHGRFEAKCNVCSKILRKDEVRFNRPTGKEKRNSHFKCVECVGERTLTGGRGDLPKDWWEKMVFKTNFTEQQKKSVHEALKEALRKNKRSMPLARKSARIPY